MSLEDFINKSQGKKYIELNNELVVPEYNRFIEMQGIDFALLDSALNKEEPCLDIKLKFHEKCMNAFNKSKKRFHLFKGSVVSFNFITLLDILYDEWTIDEFL
jgi:hypothetical protein